MPGADLDAPRGALDGLEARGYSGRLSDRGNLGSQPGWQLALMVPADWRTDGIRRKGCPAGAPGRRGALKQMV
jgi:hypothetical protein